MNTQTKISTLCLIDDDLIYLYTMKKLIEKYKLCNHVMEFKNGQEAMNYFNSVTDTTLLPQVIFLDINMPVMNGWDFVKQFTQLPYLNNSNMNLYITSSSIDSADINRARSFSVIRDYLIKPLTLDKLKSFFITYS